MRRKGYFERRRERQRNESGIRGDGVTGILGG